MRFPENVGIHAQISYDQAIGLLTQAADMAQRVPFAWAYIDKPPGEIHISLVSQILLQSSRLSADGQAYLIYILPNSPLAPPDGIRWLDQEKSYRLPVPNGRVCNSIPSATSLTSPFIRN